MTSKLLPFKFDDSERVIFIRKLSPMLIYEVSKTVPKPKPPVSKVNYGNGEVLEENLADPVYQDDLSQHKFETYRRIQRLMIERGVVIELTEDEKKEVNDLRKLFADNFNQHLEGSDVFIFVCHILIDSADALQKLVAAISGRAMPTEDAIHETEDRFRDQVQGSVT